MRTNETTRDRQMPSIPAATSWVAGLLLAGLIGWLWFDLVDGPTWLDVVLAAILVLAALVGLTWYLSHARAERRWRAALDAYAEQEQAKEAD
jgi:high-affinity Fe2+/Pb2+ permease